MCREADDSERRDSDELGPASFGVMASIMAAPCSTPDIATGAAIGVVATIASGKMLSSCWCGILSRLAFAKNAEKGSETKAIS